MSFWTDDKVEILKRMWAAGDRGSQIGAVLGCSRNAAIGKAHRMGLAMRDPPPGSGGQRRYKPAKRLAKRNDKSGYGSRPAVTSFAFGASPNVPVEPYIPEPEELNIPAHERKSFMDLDPNDCRWPIGDPQHADFGFCGREKVVGTSYCEHHCRVAFVPLEVARRNRKTGANERASERVKEKEDA